jgi:hypothetical protein
LLVEIFTKADCCLCVQAKDVLARVRAEVPFALREVDIAGDPALTERYGNEIPVVLIDGRKAFKYHVDEAELRRKLAFAGRRSGA